MKVDLIIKNGYVCTESGIVKGGLAIKDGIIVEVVAENNFPECDEVYDANGKIIFPGIIEPHVHLGLNDGEGDETGLPRYYKEIGRAHV